jgi:hypothetical protein
MSNDAFQKDKDFHIIARLTTCLKDHELCKRYYCDTFSRKLVLKCQCSCHQYQAEWT